jgi:hypothetical protein
MKFPDVEFGFGTCQQLLHVNIAVRYQQSKAIGASYVVNVIGGDQGAGDIEAN